MVTRFIKFSTLKKLQLLSFMALRHIFKKKILTKQELEIENKIDGVHLNILTMVILMLKKYNSDILVFILKKCKNFSI